MSTVTTASPPRPEVAASAVKTSSSIASIRARRCSGGSTGASRSLARSSSLTGTTAHRSISKTSTGCRQHLTGEHVTIFEGQHQGLRYHRWNAEATHLLRVSLVGNIEVQNVLIMSGNSRGGDRQTEFGHDLGGRTFDGLAADDRRYRDDRH